MAKASNKDLDVTKLVMGRLAAMPHKPHVKDKKTKTPRATQKGAKKGDVTK